MVELPRHFQRFHEGISLNPTRAKRIQRAVNSVTKFTNADRPLQQYVLGPPIRQGSFATNTVVRPLNDSVEYDVDLLLPMDFNRFPDGFFNAKRDPDYILPYLQDRLRTNYSARLERKNKCVRINYAGDFHIDLVPAHVSNGMAGPFEICDRSEGEFVETDPVAYVEWVKNLDNQFGGRFTKGIQMLKRWRDFRCGARNGPSSMHLTVLAGRGLEHFASKRKPDFTWLSSAHSGMEAFLWDAANSMRCYLDTGFFGCRLDMPGSVPEDIERTWSDDQQDALRGKLDTFINRAQKALNTNRTDTAVRRWQENFGSSFIANP